MCLIQLIKVLCMVVMCGSLYVRLLATEKLLQRIFNTTENAKICGKICDMRTLLKYGKMQQSAKYAAIAYSTGDLTEEQS